MSALSNPPVPAQGAGGLLPGATAEGIASSQTHPAAPKGAAGAFGGKRTNHETSRSLGLAAAAGAGEGVAHPAALTPRVMFLKAVKCSRKSCSRRIISDRFERCDVSRRKARFYESLKG